MYTPTHGGDGDGARHGDQLGDLRHGTSATHTIIMEDAAAVHAVRTIHTIIIHIHPDTTTRLVTIPEAVAVDTTPAAVRATPEAHAHIHHHPAHVQAADTRQEPHPAVAVQV